MLMKDDYLVPREREREMLTVFKLHHIPQVEINYKLISLNSYCVVRSRIIFKRGEKLENVILFYIICKFV